MKPLKSEVQDEAALLELGRASVQIVHDIKNQINGLKLYATFLRKRLETGSRPPDELETVAKIIAGLERAAGDMAMLVRYGRPLELHRQPRTDLARVLAAVAEGEQFEAEAGSYEGEFDRAAISEALQNITARARSGANPAGPGAGAGPINIYLRRRARAGAAAATAVVEWRGVKEPEGGSPFHSFAGGNGLRMALAAKIIEAHGGAVEHEANVWRAVLPLAS